MTTLSLILPDTLANASQAVAKKLGLSRTEFIRQAIMHEIENVRAKQEEQAIIRDMQRMKKDQGYLKVAEEITDYFHSDLPQEDEEWWKKK